MPSPLETESNTILHTYNDGYHKLTTNEKVTESISDLSQCRQLTIPQTFSQYASQWWDPSNSNHRC